MTPATFALVFILPLCWGAGIIAMWALLYAHGERLSIESR